jgi:hypothetical protein
MTEDITPTPRPSLFKTLMVTVLLLIVAGGLGWFIGRDLLIDAKIGQNYAAIEEANGIDGSCRSYMAVVNFCQVKVGKMVSGAPERDLVLAFVDMPSGDYAVTAVESPEGVMALDIGQEKLTSRWLTLGGLLFFLGLGIVQAWRQRRA